MKVKGQHYRTIWRKPENKEIIQIIDQRLLPHEFFILDLVSYEDAITAIKEMAVRGAPLIGGTAAWGMYLAALEAKREKKGLVFLKEISEQFILARPTAINLKWAIGRVLKAIIDETDLGLIIKIIEKEASDICNEDVKNCESIGKHGLELIKQIAHKNPHNSINILTHCNAGWLATIDKGTATAPIYAARDEGIDIHVWVDETRPRNQGSNLTAWELLNENIPHTIIVDNAGGHIMQHGMVDMCIVGSDRTTRRGDVANKIGTYLKALSAKDNNIPFYVALPDSTIDWNINDGLKSIPIEERDSQEVTTVKGMNGKKLQSVLIAPKESRSSNFSFDVTPAKYVTGLITPRGVCKASERAISHLYPEHKHHG